MAQVISVRFKDVGKNYHFDPQGVQYKCGDRVIVETARGIECGKVTIENKEIDDSQINAPLKAVLRLANQHDLDILEENNYEMLLVINRFRPLTKTAQLTVEVMREIEAACGLKFTDLINNSNLGNETTAQTLLDSLEFINELSTISGLPIFLHTVKSDVAQKLPADIDPVFPLQLQEKYFELSSQKSGNRPMWG